MEIKGKTKTKSKEEISEILEANDIPFSLIEFRNCDHFCITIAIEQNNCCSHPIMVQSCGKDLLYRIYPQEIVYIAIESRKSVLYLYDKTIETNYPISHWINILDSCIFAQPHYSYIVNLHYVYEVTKDAVILKCADKEFSVYTSSRKIRAFKKTLTDFYNHTHKSNE